jgi:hypothetical protein
MSRFRNELRVIPRTAWIIASVVFLATAIAAGAILWPRAVDSWTLWLLLCTVPVGAIFAIYVLLIGYVYSDARRRGMRYVVWTLLAIFVPNAIGIILYFLLRDPLQRSCPSCGAGYKAGLTYCPNCGAAVTRICRQCKCPVEDSWKNCAHCGVVV